MNDELIARFIAYLRDECGRSENTISNYNFDLQKYAQWHSRNVAKTTRLEVQQYISDLMAEGKSGSTAARKLACLRVFYRFLVDEGEIRHNPTRNMPRPKTWKKVPKTITPDELEKMVASCGPSWMGIRDRAILLTLFGSGLRESELAALQLQNIDLDLGIAKVWNGKGGKDGIVPLSVPAIQAIEKYLSEVRPRVIDGTLNPSRSTLWRRAREANNPPQPLQPSSPYLFLQICRYGQRLTRQQIFYRVRKIARAALGKDVSPHQLRHGFATALVEGGADIRDVQALMRHAVVDTTQIYVHTDINFLRRGYDASHPRARITATNRELFNVLPSAEPQPEHPARIPARPIRLRAMDETAQNPAHQPQASPPVSIAAA